ncbi:MAG: tripartite tricarboxylate transporter TctA family protein [Hyphomicrobiales bacterium]|nr:tripartite tricarboxylate transporter TctA family protein [Hyphomicrobiales bacterium]
MEIWHALGDGLFLLLEPHRMLLLWGGVLCGLALGILPGIGGVAGTALLLPFTYNMDPAAAMALLLGLAATTTHGDPISAIVLGAPGHAASAATALDGYPMTKRGEGARALGAAYMSALMGGIFGAVLMAVALPVVRPLILFIGSPELLALAVFGISMVAVLSGNTPLRGLTMACFGIMLAMIGSDPQTGTLRWTMDSLYLWEGLPLVPLTLGVFALPELCDLLVARTAVVQSGKMQNNWKGLWQGSADCITHWWLVMRCSWIGSVIGAIPGISASVIDWISYAHALKTEKGARMTFGQGDVRGVIAAESATCSREGGALIPTIVFGVPGSAGMAILLGAFLMHGLVPGPEMLTKHLAITYSMVWSIAIANILGSGLCYLFSSQFAKLAGLRYTLILPLVLSLVYIGAFEGHRNWGDLFSLLFFGIFAWGMKHFKWPRPPLVLGFILGAILERYMFISIQRYGGNWMLRPLVIVLFVMALLSLLRPFISDVKAHGGIKGLLSDFHAPKFEWTHLFPIFMLCLFGVMMAEAMTWNFSAKIIPMIVGSGAILFCSLSLLNELFKADTHKAREAEMAARGETAEKMHMDIASTISHMPTSHILLRGAIFFGWMIGFLASMALIGLIPTVPIFIVLFMRVEGREPWRIVIPMAFCVTGLVYGLFDQLLTIPWPGSVLGDAWVWWKEHVPSG